MATKLVHIGLPKCGSTYLQRVVFPEIEKEMNTNIIKKEFMDGENDLIFNVLQNEKRLENDLPSSFILSNESLFSTTKEFDKVSEAFELIKKFFS